MDLAVFTGIFRGLLGAAAIIAVAFALSEKRRDIDWRLVGSGLLLHFLLAAFLLKVPGFQDAVGWVSERFVQLLEFTGAGSRFLFGDLVDLTKTGYIFCFQVLPTVVFFSALTAALYHLGILQKNRKRFRMGHGAGDARLWRGKSRCRGECFPRPDRSAARGAAVYPPA